MKTICAILTLSMLLQLVASTTLTAGTEYRARLEVLGPVEESLDLRVLTELRSRNDLHTHNQAHSEIGLDYRLSEWLVLGPGYRHITEQKYELWRVEHRPRFDATLTWSLWELQFSNRNRLEYRMLEDREFFRYRCRVEVKAQPAGLGWLQVYASEEPFYDFDAGLINKNRLTAGFDVRVMGTIKLGFNYVVDSTKAKSGWNAVNAPTAVLKYRP